MAYNIITYINPLDDIYIYIIYIYIYTQYIYIYIYILYSNNIYIYSKIIYVILCIAFSKLDPTFSNLRIATSIVRFTDWSSTWRTLGQRPWNQLWSCPTVRLWLGWITSVAKGSGLRAKDYAASIWTRRENLHLLVQEHWNYPRTS